MAGEEHGAVLCRCDVFAKKGETITLESPLEKHRNGDLRKVYRIERAGKILFILHDELVRAVPYQLVKQAKASKPGPREEVGSTGFMPATA